MPVDVRKIRKWFAVAALAVVAAVAGFYIYGRMTAKTALGDLPPALGVEVEQSTEGFRISRSEGGRTLFTVSASRAVRFREGGRAELRDVNIIVYGRRANRFDQIYGERFMYDPASGDVTAAGEVHMDLEAHEEGPHQPDQAIPTESHNPIHLRTHDLVFNHKTGIAVVKGEIEFRFPQASGTAKGATFDSHANLLTLESDIRLETTGPQPVTLTAERGRITQQPRRTELEVVHIEQEGTEVDTDRLDVHLRPDNSVERVTAAGNVRSTSADGATLRAENAEFNLTGASRLQHALLTGNVRVETRGEQAATGTAGRVQLEFGANNQLARVRAQQGVDFRQQRASASTGAATEDVHLQAPAIDFTIRGGRALERAVTSGASQIEIAGQPAGARTVVTAGKFEAQFGAQNRLRSLRGSPDVRVVSSAPGAAERVTTSREIRAEFRPADGLRTLTQEGDFRYEEGSRSATAESARYEAESEVFTLSGSPRVTEAGASIAANNIRFNRRTGEATAEGQVRTTYTALKAAPQGGMLSGGEPVHVTSARAVARQLAGTATFSGGARLWQGASIIQAQVIEFDRDRRAVVARGSKQQPVSTAFVQMDGAGRPVPVTVTAERLRYLDSERKAVFENEVNLRGADAQMQAAQVEVFLRPRGVSSGAQTSQAGELDRIVASGDILIQQPTRRAQGSKLVYTASDGKFELSGVSGKPPSIFDAELGSVTGDSLTFFSRDDRVLVGSGEDAPSVTRTRVQQTSRR